MKIIKTLRWVTITGSKTFEYMPMRQWHESGTLPKFWIQNPLFLLPEIVPEIRKNRKFLDFSLKTEVTDQQMKKIFSE